MWNFEQCKKIIGFAAKNRNFIQFHLPFGKMYYCFVGMNAHTRLSVLLSTIVFVIYGTRVAVYATNWEHTMRETQQQC